VKEECNSTRAILSVGDMAKYEVVEIVANLFNFPTHTKQYHNRYCLGSIGPKIVVSPLAIVNKI
jgi:hypothetical protein